MARLASFTTAREIPSIRRIVIRLLFLHSRHHRLQLRPGYDPQLVSTLPYRSHPGALETHFGQGLANPRKTNTSPVTPSPASPKSSLSALLCTPFRCNPTIKSQFSPPLPYSPPNGLNGRASNSPSLSPSLARFLPGVAIARCRPIWNRLTMGMLASIRQGAFGG